VPHVRQGALKSDKQAQAWHYQNPKFKRGRPDLLPFIARKGKPIGSSANNQQHNLALQPIKQADLENEIDLLSGPINDDMTINTSGGAEVAKGSPQNLDMIQIINGLATIKRHQTLISDNLKELQGSNQALWQEAMEARERHRKHQETINRILKFLASLFQGASNSPVRSAGTAPRKDGTVPVLPRPILMIKGAPEHEEDKDSSATSPKSTRMEEVDFTDEEPRSSELGSWRQVITEPDSITDSSGMTRPSELETPRPTPSRPQSDGAPPGYPPSGFNSSNTMNGYPFQEQGHYLANGTYIPPTDIYKILQWLQQNQIPIPGVYNPTTADPQALATIPASGHFNPLNFSNAQPLNSNVMSNPQPNGWPTYGSPLVANSSAPTTMTNAMYQNSNQLFNSLLPLASVANEPATNIAEVAHSSDKLDQLSNHVEAMQQGIDSLIAGMGLDPLSAESIQVDGTNTNPLGPILNTDPNQFSGSTLPSNEFVNHPQNTDTASYQAPPFDFDLDSLLKQLGMAAAASTPPPLHSGEDFTEVATNDSSSFANQMNAAFDPSLFNEMNMYNQTNESSYFGTQGMNSATNGQSQSGFLNEITTSPAMTRDDSAEPAGSGEMPGGNNRGRAGGAHGRVKKRKNDTVSDDGGAPSGFGPIRRHSRSSGRNTKRRK
jgi:hypothetical protein